MMPASVILPELAELAELAGMSSYAQQVLSSACSAVLQRCVQIDVKFAKSHFSANLSCCTGQDLVSNIRAYQAAVQLAKQVAAHINANHKANHNAHHAVAKACIVKLKLSEQMIAQLVDQQLIDMKAEIDKSDKVLVVNCAMPHHHQADIARCGVMADCLARMMAMRHDVVQANIAEPSLAELHSMVDDLDDAQEFDEMGDAGDLSLKLRNVSIQCGQGCFSKTADLLCELQRLDIQMYDQMVLVVPQEVLTELECDLMVLVELVQKAKHSYTTTRVQNRTLLQNRRLPAWYYMPVGATTVQHGAIRLSSIPAKQLQVVSRLFVSTDCQKALNVDLSNLAEPAKPAEPAEPATPAKPAEPAKPAKPANQTAMVHVLDFERHVQQACLQRQPVLLSRWLDKTKQYMTRLNTVQATLLARRYAQQAAKMLAGADVKHHMLC